jgi:hypothetical protein
MPRNGVQEGSRGKSRPWAAELWSLWWGYGDGRQGTRRRWCARRTGSGLAAGVNLGRKKLGREQVAATSHGLDDALVLVTERFPDVPDAPDKRVVAHCLFAPDCRDQLILGHEPAGMLGQVAEHVEGLSPETDLDRAAVKHATQEIDGERIEAHHPLLGRGTHPSTSPPPDGVTRLS